MPDKFPNFSFAKFSIFFLLTFSSFSSFIYKSFITLLTQTSIGNTSNLFSSENNNIQSATLGPTPESFNNSSLTFNVSFSSFKYSRSISLFKIICVVSYSLISLNPRPNFLYCSIVTSFN